MASQPSAMVPPPYAPTYFAPGPKYDGPAPPPPGKADEYYGSQVTAELPYRPQGAPDSSYQPPPGPGVTEPMYHPQQQPLPSGYAPSYAPPSHIQVLGPSLVVNQLGSATVQPLPLATAAKPNLGEVKTATEFALREYMSLQRRRYRTDEPGADERLRIQAATVLGDLRALRHEVSDVVRSAESHRWRRFIIGSALYVFTFLRPWLPILARTMLTQLANE